MSNLTNKKKEIIQDISIVSASTYFAQMLYFLRGFLNANIVGPTMYGVWAALTILLTFGSYVHLGVLEGMSREIPYAMGKDDSAKADGIRANAFGFCVAGSLVIGFCSILFAFIFRESIGPVGFFGTITVSLLILLQNMILFYEKALAAVKRFSVIVASDVVFPLSYIILTLILVPTWKIYGIFAVALLVPLTMCLFYYLKTGYRPRLIFDRESIFSLVKIGFPVTALLMVPFVLFTIDRLFIFKFLGARELGYYALALLVSKSLLYFPAVVSIVIGPRLFHSYGKGENVEDLKKYLFLPTKAMSIFLPMGIGIIYLASSFIIRHYMPQYMASQTPLFILLFGKFFIIFAPTAVTLLTALNKQYKVLYYYLAAMLLASILDIMVLRAGLGLVGVALATTAVSFLLGTAIFLYAAGSYLKRRRDFFLNLARLYFPYTNVLCLTVILNSLFKNREAFVPDLLTVSLKILALLVISLPFIIRFNREIGFYRIIVQMFRAKWKNLLRPRLAKDSLIQKKEILAIEEVSTIEGFAAMRDAWEDILLKSGSDNIFLTFDWLSRWWRHFSGNSRLFILKIIENDQLIGIAPLMIKRQRVFFFPVRVVSFIGTDVSGRMDFILTRSREESLRAVFCYIKKNLSRWDFMDLQEMPDYTENFELLRACVRELKLPMVNGPDSKTFYIPLNGDRESFINSLPRKARHKLKNSQNRVKKMQSEFRFKRFIGDAVSSEFLTSEMERIEGLSWKGQLRKGIFSKRASRFFHREIIRDYSKNGLADISFLSVGNENIAYSYNFLYANREYGYSTSYDSKYSSVSPGFVLFAININDSPKHGAREFDFLSGEQKWKQTFAKQFKIHSRTRIFNNTVYSRLLYIVPAYIVPFLKRNKWILAAYRRVRVGRHAAKK